MLAPSPVWREVYDDAMKPLAIDIKGLVADSIALGQRRERRVEVDIGEPLVERGLSWGEASGIVGNIHFATCNATVSIGEWVKSCLGNSGRGRLVTILHPDPHFKSKAQEASNRAKAAGGAIGARDASGTRVYLQSDVEGD